MSTLEKNVPYSFISIIGALFLLLFIPILLYAVYQTAILATHAKNIKANILVHADQPGPSFLPNKAPSQTVSPQSIISLMNSLSGYPLPLQGNGTWVWAIAVKNSDTITVLVYNAHMTNTYSEVIPVTVTGLTGTEYISDISFMKQEGCSINSTPQNTQPQQESLTTHLCLKGGNAALWKIMTK